MTGAALERIRLVPRAPTKTSELNKAHPGIKGTSVDGSTIPPETVGSGAKAVEGSVVYPADWMDFSGDVPTGTSGTMG